MIHVANVEIKKQLVLMLELEKDSISLLTSEEKWSQDEDTNVFYE